MQMVQLLAKNLHHQFEMTLEARVGERTRIARELHDTLLQKFQGLLPRVQAAIYKLPSSAVEARKILEAAVDLASARIALAQRQVVARPHLEARPTSKGPGGDESCESD